MAVGLFVFPFISLKIIIGLLIITWETRVTECIRCFGGSIRRSGDSFRLFDDSFRHSDDSFRRSDDSFRRFNDSFRRLYFDRSST